MTNVITTNLNVKELKEELKRLEIEFPTDAKKDELAAMVADAHGDPEGTPHKITEEDLKANDFGEDVKLGDIVIIPKVDDDGAGEGGNGAGAGDGAPAPKKPELTPRQKEKEAAKRERKDGEYVVKTPVKVSGRIFKAGETVQLSAADAVSLGKAVEEKE